MTPLAAIAAAAFLSLVAARRRWLSPSGAVAAAAAGSTILALGGWGPGALLAVFFVTGSLLTYAVGASEAWTDRSERGGRSARQVLANGGWAVLGAALIPMEATLGWAILAGSLAAAQGDTWATEIGAASSRPPRLILGLREVRPGTSGGVTVLGTLAGAAGAALLAALAAVVDAPPGVACAAGCGGVAGMLADSVLGAGLQGAYWCDACGVPTERRPHGCGTRPRLVRGAGWIDNDAVNAIATGIGAGVAAVLLHWA